MGIGWSVHPPNSSHIESQKLIPIFGSRQCLCLTQMTHWGVLPITEPSLPRPTSLIIDCDVDGQRLINLKDDWWIDVWIPQVEPLDTTVTHAVQCIGGVRPYFIEKYDIQWPELRGQPMKFVTQFVDPRPGRHDRLVRLFIRETEHPHELRRNDGRLQSLSLQDIEAIHLPTPDQVSDLGWSRQIIGWRHSYEVNLAKLLQHLVQMVPSDVNVDLILVRVELKLLQLGLISYDFKVGGYAETYQDHDQTVLPLCGLIQYIRSGRQFVFDHLSVTDDGSIWQIL